MADVDMQLWWFNELLFFFLLGLCVCVCTVYVVCVCMSAQVCCIIQLQPFLANANYTSYVICMLDTLLKE